MKLITKINRAKRIIVITISLLLVAAVADAQLNRNRHAQQPQPQLTQQQTADAAQYEPGHVCSRDCFTTTFNADNTRFILKRSKKCNEAIILGYILRNKETQVEEAEQMLYLPADKEAVSIRTKGGYDYLISKWYHPDESEIYERQLREKVDISYKWDKYMNGYMIIFKNKTGKPFTIFMEYREDNGWHPAVAQLDRYGGSAYIGPEKKYRYKK